MTWTEAVEAMRDGRFVRCVGWEKNSIIRMSETLIEYPRDSVRGSCLISEDKKDVNFSFILNDLCADDWVVSEFILQPDGKWKVVNDLA